MIGKCKTRALCVYQNIQKYVKDSKLPNNFIVNSVKDAVDDILMPVRISFFQYVASVIKPFLKFFQSDKPLSSFLYQELEKIIYSLLEKFIKPEVLAVNKSVFKMMKLDLNAKQSAVQKCENRHCDNITQQIQSK